MKSLLVLISDSKVPLKEAGYEALVEALGEGLMRSCLIFSRNYPRCLSVLIPLAVYIWLID